MTDEVKTVVTLFFNAYGDVERVFFVRTGNKARAIEAVVKHVSREGHPADLNAIKAFRVVDVDPNIPEVHLS